MDERAVEDGIRDLTIRLGRLEETATAEARTLRRRSAVLLVVAGLAVLLGLRGMGSRGEETRRAEMAAARSEDAARRAESAAARIEAAAARAEAAAQKTEQMFVKLQRE